MFKRFRYTFIHAFGAVGIRDTWFGTSSLVITDDFGNGIELTSVPVAQWGYTTAN